ncbi:MULTISPECIES: tol-pal system protein YbgF [unclassified Arsenophonus]|uniref:tol-pal system protein YbgF n=1 Tax=unclassified Arsenophonus TaxID=2627083 RepID=UPI002866BBCA|nr:tol-pal system protein YbgF [Arsenophonus sp.]MDR5614225.1 tol-pal system protein YbgF [Arsenophonus sp.]
MNSNFRHLYLSLSLLVGVAAPVVATAQAPIINVGSGSTSDRLMQIETAVNSQGQLLYKIQQQLSDAQRDIDTLRGQIQENQYQLSQVIERQKDLYTQLDSLTTGANKVKASIDSSNNAVVTAKPANEKAEYDAAVALAIKSKSKLQIAQAISSFQHFIKTYPKSNYQPNANYWLGQLNYNQGNKDDAAFYFATVVKNYPNSAKGAESLYKVGLLMQEKGQNDKARVVYQQVIKAYPSSPSAKLAEKKLASL